MKSMCIITARGGSKRIHKKNIKEFCGKPIIAYSIKTALKSGLFDHVMVSTDDFEIAEVAKKFGAEIPFMRSEKTSDDFANTEDVLVEVLEQYREQGVNCEYACCVYPTAPFITVERLKDAYKKLSEEADAKVVFPVVPFSFPPQRGLHQSGKFMSPVQPEDYLKRSQDLEPIYHDAGQFYFFKTEQFLETHCLFENIAPLIIDEMEVQDIDNETDWKLAELKFKLLNSSN